MDELIHFPGREEALAQIYRYSIRPIMHYRANLVTHTKHVYWLVKKYAPVAAQVFGSDFDTAKACLMALVHDDIEIVIGDIQAGNKYKMTETQLNEVKEKELQAIETLSERFPRILGGYEYRALLKEAQEKQTLESQFVSYMDKLDALGETLHELYSGNATFAEPIHNEYGDIPSPIDFYNIWLSKREHKLPLLVPLFTSKKDVFDLLENKDFYDLWKACILESGDKEEIQKLYTISERSLL